MQQLVQKKKRNWKLRPNKTRSDHFFKENYLNFNKRSFFFLSQEQGQASREATASQLGWHLEEPHPLPPSSNKFY